MATLTEFFDAEAKRYVQRLTELATSPAPDAAEVYRNARGLRGSAQMAREDRVYRSALALETGARALLQGALAWSEDVAGRIRQSVDDIDALVQATGTDDPELDALSAVSAERWGSAGVALPAGTSGHTAHTAGSDAVQEFRAFAAAEVEGIADALDRGVQALSDNSMDREALKTILRRQRALLGAARLNEIPVVAEMLRAVEDLTRVIAKLDVGVKREWLDIYRVAREGLKATIDPLRANEDPESSHSLARLRHMRSELLERYGSGEAVSAAGGPEQGLVQAMSMSEPPRPGLGTTTGFNSMVRAEPHADAAESAAAEAQLDSAPDRSDAQASSGGAENQPIVDVAELQYRGSSALNRALELRTDLERVAAGSPEARAVIDELFDLIELARE